MAMATVTATAGGLTTTSAVSATAPLPEGGGEVVGLESGGGNGKMACNVVGADSICAR